MVRKTAAVLLVLATTTTCDSNPDAALGPDLSRDTFMQSSSGARAVTGSGHYTTHTGQLRTFSFQVRERPNGTVHGTFELTLHRKPTGKLHGPLTCFSVMGNEAWIGGIYEKATNPNLVGTGFGFYVKDNGQGSHAPPDLLRRHVRGQIPDEWCAEMPDVSGSQYLFQIESGNIQIHER